MLTRRGVTLVELIVALTLGLVLVTSLSRALHAQRRAERASAAARESEAAVDEAVRVLESRLARVAARDSVVVRGDTAVEWMATLGAGVACLAAGDSIAVPDSALGVWWETSPDSGDAVDIETPGGSMRTAIVDVGTRAGGGACGVRHRVLRVRDSIGVAGVYAIRVARRTRMMLYRGGDRLWWLGERRCSLDEPVTCSAAQPVAGPLSGPPAALRITVDSGGTARAIRIAAAAGTASRLAISARER